MFTKKERNYSDKDKDIVAAGATITGGLGVALILVIATSSAISTGGIILAGVMAGVMLCLTAYLVFGLLKSCFSDKEEDPYTTLTID